MNASPTGYDWVFRLDPRVKLALFAGLVVCAVSASPRDYPVFLVYGIFLFFCVGLIGVPHLAWMKRMLPVIPFILMMFAFAPFMPAPASASGAKLLGICKENLVLLSGVAMKSVIGVAGASLLTLTTPPDALFNAMGRLGVPDAFVSILHFTFRYLHLSADEAKTMRLAADSRGYGARWIWQSGTIGNLTGALFIRGFERAERVHRAMLSRGFKGKYHYDDNRALGAFDVAFGLSMLGLIITIRLFI